MGDRGETTRHRATLCAVGADHWHRAGRFGQGVVVALADYGFDVLHPALRDEGGGSRLAALWDQNAAGPLLADLGVDGSGPALLPGELDRAALDALIADAARSGDRTACDAAYDPHAAYYGRASVVGGAHGTFMATIAAGTRRPLHAGVAPEATLLAAQLALPDCAWREEDAHGRPTWLDVPEDALAAWDGWRAYDAAAATVAAIRYLYARAVALRPAGIVLNVSLGTWAGAHDGGSPVERELSRIASAAEAGEGPPCVVVVGAGNAGSEQGHCSGTVTGATPVGVDWQMTADDPTANKLEIWYRAAAPFALDLAHGEAHIELAVGVTRPLVVAGRRIGIFDHSFDVRGGLSRVRIILHPPAFAGALTPAASGQAQGGFAFTITARARDAAGGTLHAWLERDDGPRARSTLSPCALPSTLSCLAAASGAIVVGGFELQTARDDSVAGARRFPFASHGPLPWHGAGDAALVPHLSAPAHGVVGAVSKTSGYGFTSGTSAAAALVSGAAALLIEDAVARGTRPGRDAILAGLLGRSSPPGADDRADWDTQLGFGPLALAAPSSATTDLTSPASSRKEHAGTHSRA